MKEFFRISKSYKIVIVVAAMVSGFLPYSAESINFPTHTNQYIEPQIISDEN